MIVLPDRTLNTLLKEVVLKGVIVIFHSQSPTKNKKAAVQKMLEAGEFIEKYGVSMDQDAFDSLLRDSEKLALKQHDVETGWGDVLAHPITTFTSARKLKSDANQLLLDAQSASSVSKINQAARAREARAAETAAQPTHVTARTSEGAATASAYPTNVTAPPTALPSPAAYTRTRLEILAVQYSPTGNGDPQSQLTELEVKIPLDHCTRLDFDGQFLTAKFQTGPIICLEFSSGEQQARTVKRSATAFTATGTARIVPQNDPSSGHDHCGEAPAPCKFEWVEGPFITALKELGEGQSETTDSASDSDFSSD